MSPCPCGQKSKLSQPFSLSAAGSSYLASLERSLTRTIAAQVVAIVVNSILLVSVYIRAIRGRYMFAGMCQPLNLTELHGTTDILFLLALAGRNLNYLNQESLFICLDSLDLSSVASRILSSSTVQC